MIHIKLFARHWLNYQDIKILMKTRTEVMIIIKMIQNPGLAETTEVAATKDEAAAVEVAEARQSTRTSLQVGDVAVAVAAVADIKSLEEMITSERVTIWMRIKDHEEGSEVDAEEEQGIQLHLKVQQDQQEVVVVHLASLNTRSMLLDSHLILMIVKFIASSKKMIAK